MRRAKIICTLGPSTDDPAVLEAVIAAGMDVARFNFSHGDHEQHSRRFALVRKLAKKVGRTVAVMQDLQGPKIRLGQFEGGQAEVRDGATVVVTTRNVLGTSELIPTPIQSLTRDVRKGDPILLDDGRVRLEVVSVKRKDVTCRVVQGGMLRDRKGLNLPGSPMSVETLTEKDLADLELGQKLGVDYVALSFVRSAEDVHRARAYVARTKTPLIAKIEKPQAVDDLEAIARASDGVMIARGDLGVEMPLEKLPGIQKRAVQLVNRQGGLVIVATEMFESMIRNPRPTRAEVSDVANAILDGADAVMLSGETAAGLHPVDAVRHMSNVVTEVEEHLSPRVDLPPDRTDDISTGVAAAAVTAANQLGATVIVAYTESGHTARMISEFRPRARVLGFTPNPRTVSRMALYWGVEPKLVARVQSTDAMIRQVQSLCREARYCAGGTPVVIVTGVPLNQPGNTNLITIQRL